jgi:SAM-dependent methyltransferase
VVGIDLAAGMLARARENAGDLPVEFRRMDAEALEFDDGIFDVVLCGFAVSFLPGVVRGMREMHRVLRKDGTVAFSTFTREAFQPHGRIMASRFGQYGIVPPPPPAASWMALREPEHLLILLEEGGFHQRRVVRKPAGHVLSTADEYWDFVWGNGYWRKALSRLEPEALARLRAELLFDIERLRTDRGIWVDTSALFGIGVKP